MAALPVLRELPSDVVVKESSRGVLACRADRLEDLMRAGFGPDGGGGRPSSDLSGRGPMGEIETSAGTRLVIRPFRHGGLARWLTGTRFADPERPFRELILCDRVRGAGLPTPPVVAARAVRAPGFGWHLDLVSERIENVHDLAEVLEFVREGRIDRPTRARLTERIGELLGRMHEAGLWHADLQPRNLLLETALLEAPSRKDGLWILDLEGSTLGRLDEERRIANLARFGRALARRESRGLAFLRRTDVARFFRSYGRAAGLEGPQVRKLWAATQGRILEQGGRHRLGWWLESRLGGVEARDGAARVARGS